MPNWGVTSAGFVRPRFDEIRANAIASFRSIFGANRPADRHDTVDGMLVDLVSEAEDRFWEALSGNYDAHYLASASGVSLDQWAADHGFPRNPATSSTVQLTLAGDDSTVIPAGSLVRLTDTNEQWATDEESTISGGTASVTATAVDTGPVQALIGSDWEIVNPIVGWSGVVNPEDADLGSNEETDAELRARIRAAVRRGGLAAALLRLTGVTAVTIFENDTDTPDALYNATHWVEAMVQGGDDQEIVDTIWRYLAEGIGTEGTDSLAESVSGDAELVNYSRPADADVYLEVDITPGEGFDASIATTSIRDALVLWGDASHEAGEDVSPIEVTAQVAANVVGKFSAVVRLGLAPSPAGTGILAIDERSIARFDTARTTVAIV